MRILCLDPASRGTCGGVVLRDRLAGRHLKAVVSRLQQRADGQDPAPRAPLDPEPALDVLDPADRRGQ
jgi:hypothetical protein